MLEFYKVKAHLVLFDIHILTNIILRDIVKLILSRLATRSLRTTEVLEIMCMLKLTQVVAFWIKGEIFLLYYMQENNAKRREENSPIYIFFKKKLIFKVIADFSLCSSTG